MRVKELRALLNKYVEQDGFVDDLPVFFDAEGKYLDGFVDDLPVFFDAEGKYLGRDIVAVDSASWSGGSDEAHTLRFTTKTRGCVSLESYEDLEFALRKVPTTWIPALLSILVQESVKKKVFREGSTFNLDGLLEFIDRARLREEGKDGQKTE